MFCGEREMWDRYVVRTYKVVQIPFELREAMRKYTLFTKAKQTHIFDSAVFELMRMWEKGENVGKALRLNPPPDSEKMVPLQVRFTGEQSFKWVCDLEAEYAYISSTQDFVKRALSWFLRQNDHCRTLDEYTPTPNIVIEKKEKKSLFRR